MKIIRNALRVMKHTNAPAINDRCVRCQIGKWSSITDAPVYSYRQQLVLFGNEPEV